EGEADERRHVLAEAAEGAAVAAELPGRAVREALDAAGLVHLALGAATEAVEQDGRAGRRRHAGDGGEVAGGAIASPGPPPTPMRARSFSPLVLAVLLAAPAAAQPAGAPAPTPADARLAGLAQRRALQAASLVA